MPSAQNGRIVSVEREKASITFTDYGGFKTTATFDRSIELNNVTDLRTRYKVGSSVFFFKKTNPIELTFVCLESETITGEAEIIVVLPEHALGKMGNGKSIYIPMARVSEHRNYKKYNGNLALLLVLGTKIWVRGVANLRNDKLTWTNFKAIEVRLPPELMLPGKVPQQPTKIADTPKSKGLPQKSTSFMSPLILPPPLQQSKAHDHISSMSSSPSVWNKNKIVTQTNSSRDPDLDFLDYEEGIELELELRDMDFSTIIHAEKTENISSNGGRNQGESSSVDEKSELQLLVRQFIESEDLLTYVNRQYPRLFAKAYSA
uniref:Uncharacterized protein n=1 Tax=Plectus sambesii TaxID=2011161 RepID=A0A914XJH3_9BILA